MTSAEKKDETLERAAGEETSFAHGAYKAGVAHAHLAWHHIIFYHHLTASATLLARTEGAALLPPRTRYAAHAQRA